MTNGNALPEATVDTNLLVSGIINRRGRPAALQQALRARRFYPVLTRLLRAEYGRVQPRRRLADEFGVDPIEVAELLALIDETSRIVEPLMPLPVAVRDSKDEMVLATALAAPHGYLISGDDDLLSLRDEPLIAPLRIVTVREFLDAIGW